jgi:hypothetical protein
MALEIIEEGGPVGLQAMRLEIAQRKREAVVDADQRAAIVTLRESPSWTLSFRACVRSDFHRVAMRSMMSSPRQVSSASRSSRR